MWDVGDGGCKDFRRDGTVADGMEDEMNEGEWGVIIHKRFLKIGRSCIVASLCAIM